MHINRTTRELRELSNAELFELYRDGKVGSAQLMAVQRAKTRMKMRERVSLPPKQRWAYRVGYNSCSVSYCSDEELPILSGSSWNRKNVRRDPREWKINQQEDEDTLRPIRATVHKFSTRSKRKVRDKSMAFFRSIFKDRVFLTLTFIQDIPDAQATSILNKFLTVVRKEREGVEYLWVAEPQKQNNNRIHFHILLNRRLPIRRYNDLWIMQQYNDGLLGRVGEKRAKKRGDQVGREVPYHEIEAAYRSGTVKDYFNGADIEPAYSAAGMAAYLTKYVTKQDSKHEMGCLTWHCSRKVSRMFTRELTGPSTFSYLLRFDVNCYVDKRTGEVKSPPPAAYHGQFFSSVQIHNKAAPLPKLKTLENVNRWIMEGLQIAGRKEIPVMSLDRIGSFYN